MVSLTVDLISKSNHFKKKRGVSFAQYLQTLTHLHFSNKNIEHIVSTSLLNCVFIRFVLLNFP